MNNSFPTFEQLATEWRFPRWIGTPWWPADSLASKQTLLLRVLCVAIPQRLEIAPLVVCLAEEHRGRYRRRLLRLAKHLDEGTSLPDSLEQIPGTLSDEQILNIRLGMQSGTLNETFQRMLAEQTSSGKNLVHRIRQMSTYATFIGSIFLLVLSFISIKIIPSFVLIFEDFSLDLPRISQYFIRIIVAFVNNWLPIVLAVLFVVWLLKSETSRRFFRRHVLSRFLPPVIQLRSASLLNQLGIAHQAGRPLPGILSSLARYHYDSTIRKKLLFVRNEVEQGADIWNSMRTVHLVTPAESQTLSCPVPADCKSWTLHRLADAKRQHVATRLELFIQILQPLVVVFLAAIVLFAAVACLAPMFNMIEALC